MIEDSGGDSYIRSTGYGTSTGYTRFDWAVTQAALQQARDIAVSGMREPLHFAERRKFDGSIAMYEAASLGLSHH